jgi:hypothetical protein
MIILFVVIGMMCVVFSSMLSSISGATWWAFSSEDSSPSPSPSSENESDDESSKPSSRFRWRFNSGSGSGSSPPASPPSTGSGSGSGSPSGSASGSGSGSGSPSASESAANDDSGINSLCNVAACNEFMEEWVVNLEWLFETDPEGDPYACYHCPKRGHRKTDSGGYELYKDGSWVSAGIASKVVTYNELKLPTNGV